jgi:signal transduction histidine kinase/DNA-binding LacI/PurR family transcriptional regulator
VRIGLFLRNLDEEFQITVFRGVRARARARGAQLVCVQGETDYERDSRAVRPFDLAGRVRFDGLLVLSPVVSDRADFFAGPMQGLLPNVPCVSVGLRVAGLASLSIRSGKPLAELVGHLALDHGCRRFLFIGGPRRHRETAARERVFRRVLSGLRTTWPDLAWEAEYGDFNEYTSMEIVRRRLAGPAFDAIVAANDNMAVGALKALRLAGDPAWRRCAVTGFDDIPQAASEIPPITSIRQPMEELGERSVDLLIDLAEGRPAPLRRSIPARTVIRESCGCLPRGWPPAGGQAGADLASLAARLGELRRSGLEMEQKLRIVGFFGRDLSSATELPEIAACLDMLLGGLGMSDFYLFVADGPAEGGGDAAGPAADGAGRLVYRRSSGRREAADGRATGLDAFFAARELAAGPSWDLGVARLDYGDEHLGYAVHDVDERIQIHVAAAMPHLANALKRLRLIEAQANRNRELARQVERRTRDLVAEVELRKEKERELARQRGLLEQILKSLPVPLAVFGRGGGAVLYANAAFEDLAGGPAAGRPIGGFIALPDSCRGLELELRAADAGRPAVPVLAYCVPLDFDSRPAALAALVDLRAQRALESEVLQISEYERRRFGLDLHDDICQRLAGIAMWARGFDAAEALRAPLAEIAGLVEETLELTRRYARASFPMELERYGLDEALRSLCRNVAEQHRIDCRYASGLAALDPPLEPNQALNAYRIVQEALRNAVRHAGATALRVEVRAAGGALDLAVSDDGRGMDAAARTGGGLGLRSMAYRASQLGAALRVESAPGRGTTVRLAMDRGRG